jgi:hypothetical protein
VQETPRHLVRRQASQHHLDPYLRAECSKFQGCSGSLMPQGQGAGSHPVFEASLRTQRPGLRARGVGACSKTPGEEASLTAPPRPMRRVPVRNFLGVQAPRGREQAPTQCLRQASVHKRPGQEARGVGECSKHLVGRHASQHHLSPDKAPNYGHRPS